jgi:hypothetical protein
MDDPGLKRWAAALLGPALAGAILGLREGPRSVAVLALGLPALIAAVVLMTAPTLYVGGTLVGRRLSLAETVAAIRKALGALGVAFLGVAPAALFLGATTWQPSDARLYGLALLGVAVVIGLHRLRTELGGAGSAPAAFALFAGYALIASTIGGRLLGQLLHFAARGAS